MGKNSSPKKILEVIKSSKNILIIMNSRFDYDALGSTLAFGKFLDQLNIKHTSVYNDEIPPKAKDVFNIAEIKQKVSFENFDYGPYDLVVFLDTGNLKHFSDYCTFTPPKDKNILNIDHHAGNDFFGTYNYAFVQASACSVLYDLLKERRVKISPEMANCLLAGHISDTGVFKYDLVNAKELRTAAELTDLGGNYYKIIENITMNESPEDMRVKGLIYSRLTIDKKRKYAYSYLLKEDLKKYKLDKFITNASDLIRPLDGVDFVFAIKTKEGINNWIVSLRSHTNNYNVLRIAQALGGGGHKSGASGTIPFKDAKTIEEVAEKVWERAVDSKEN